MGEQCGLIFEMDCSSIPNIMVFTTLNESNFLAFGMSNAKYLAFDTHDGNALKRRFQVSLLKVIERRYISYTHSMSQAEGLMLSSIPQLWL